MAGSDEESPEALRDRAVSELIGELSTLPPHETAEVIA